MFHKSNLGIFGENLPCDMRGYVAEDGDSRSEFVFEDNLNTMYIYHDNDVYEEWLAWVAECVSATKKAEKALQKWREQ